jgi:6-phosphogluconolactonase (cycloisomerase 2 family)
VSNYLGNLTVFALDSEGAILQVADQHSTGFGTHSTALDPSLQFAFTPILGEDRILQWVVKGGATLVTNPTAASVQLGAAFGPRHMAFHPGLPKVFVADEGSGNATRLTVCSFDEQSGVLDVLQTLSVTNLSNVSSLYPSEVVISPDGRFVYVSVRDAQAQQDSIAVLSVGTAGDLKLLANTPVAWYPRSIALVSPVALSQSRSNRPSKDALFLLVGAQKAHVLQVFSVDLKTGLLANVHQDITFSDAVAFVGEL